MSRTVLTRSVLLLLAALSLSLAGCAAGTPDPNSDSFVGFSPAAGAI